LDLRLDRDNMIQHFLIEQDGALSIRSSVQYILKIWAVEHAIKNEPIRVSDLRQIMRYNEERLARKIGTDIVFGNLPKDSQDE